MLKTIKKFEFRFYKKIGCRVEPLAEVSKKAKGWEKCFAFFNKGLVMMRKAKQERCFASLSMTRVFGIMKNMESRFCNFKERCFAFSAKRLSMTRKSVARNVSVVRKNGLQRLSVMRVFGIVKNMESRFCKVSRHAELEQSESEASKKAKGQKRCFAFAKQRLSMTKNLVFGNMQNKVALFGAIKSRVGLFGVIRSRVVLCRVIRSKVGLFGVVRSRGGLFGVIRSRVTLPVFFVLSFADSVRAQDIDCTNGRGGDGCIGKDYNKSSGGTLPYNLSGTSHSIKANKIDINFLRPFQYYQNGGRPPSADCKVTQSDRITLCDVAVKIESVNTDSNYEINIKNILNAHRAVRVIQAVQWPLGNPVPYWSYKLDITINKNTNIGTILHANGFTEEPKDNRAVVDGGVMNITLDKGKNLNVDRIIFGIGDLDKVFNRITRKAKGKINLSAEDGDVVIKDINGTPDHSITLEDGNPKNVTQNQIRCAEGGGICNLNILEITAKNFYGGNFEISGISNATARPLLDLSKVSDNTFIDFLKMHAGELKASNFHFNTLFVNNNNTDKATLDSQATSNIGKSFINYAIIGTSHLQNTNNTNTLIGGGVIDFMQGGEILNINHLYIGAAAKFKAQNANKINNINIDKLSMLGGEGRFQNIIFNDIQIRNTQSLTSETIIAANAMNINNTMYLMDGSSNGAVVNITLSDENITQSNGSEYLRLNVDSNTLKSMNASELQNLITESEANLTTKPHKNISGTYIESNDNKKYVLLPGIASHDSITNIKACIAELESDTSTCAQSQNAGNILVEQSALDKKTLNNYGIIYIDSGLNEKSVKLATAPKLTLAGNLNNHDRIIIGANASIEMKGNLNNKSSNIIFKMQDSYADNAALNAKRSEIEHAEFNITGKATFDVSPGVSNGIYADISDMQTLRNLKTHTIGTSIENDANTYKLMNITDGMQFTYTYKDYTTTFESSTSIKTESNLCANNTCDTLDLNNGSGAQQQTGFSTNKVDNPWNMNKAQNDSTGGKNEKPLGDTSNNGVLIEKPSQADKVPECKNGFCGFGNLADSEAARGYAYGQEKLKDKIYVTYKGSSIDGRYLQAEKLVNDTDIGFRIVNKTNEPNFKEDIPLCSTLRGDAYECVLFTEAGGNNSWINALKKESKNSYEILRELFYHKNSEILTLIQLDQSLALSRNIAYFLEVGRTLDTTFNHISSLENKSANLQTLNIAMDTAKYNRLARISYYKSPEYETLAYNEYKQNLEKAIEIAANIRYAKVDSIWRVAKMAIVTPPAMFKYDEMIGRDGEPPTRHAEALRSKAEASIIESGTTQKDASHTLSMTDSPSHTESSEVSNTKSIESNFTQITSDSDSNMSDGEIWFKNVDEIIEKFQKRYENPNNLWANMLGHISFVTTGSNQLYGISAGYDYYSKSLHTAFGLYSGYGYGIFTGNNNGYISNNSHNVFAGIYTRTFLGNNEFDVTINASRGFIVETLQHQKMGFDLLDLFNQKYNYNVTNLDSNFTYGYAFILKKGYTIKPTLGLSYYLNAASSYERQDSKGIFAIDTNANNRQALSANIGIEARKYFKNESFVFLTTQFRQDIYVLQNNLKDSISRADISVVSGGSGASGASATATGGGGGAGAGGATGAGGAGAGGAGGTAGAGGGAFGAGGAGVSAGGTSAVASNAGALGSESIAFSQSYRGDNLRSHLLITGGGELNFGRFYLNGALSAYSSVISKNFGFNINLGFRFIF